jgi:multidrug resistance protein MdtO
LAGVEDLLNCYAADRPVDENVAQQVARMAVVGTSILRRLLRRSVHSPQYKEQVGGVVALVGSLVDIAASFDAQSIQVSGDDRKRIGGLSRNIGSIRADLLSGRSPRLTEPLSDTDASPSIPLLREMERTVSLIPEVFTGAQSPSAYAPLPAGDEPAMRLFVADALSNPEHLKFALKGCLAASLCYIVYTALAWPEISTAVVTCVLTALTTIGASRQKQVLRLSGALAGGAVGIAALVFILPYLDSISGFAVVFLVVTIPAAWIATSSPRLSYFGVQFALAFYLMNLQEFKLQTSLEVTRDRVLGILLGLMMMWLVFDQLWSAPAAIEMRRAFISNLRSLARLVREPLPGSEKTWSSDSLRERINAGFDNVRSLGDGVLFEFGPSRQQDLALRDRIRRWQPGLRLLFLTRVALLKYRLRLPGFELPEPVRLAQKEFDDQLAITLDGMADRLEGKGPEVRESLEVSLERLEKTTATCCSELPEEALAPQLRSFLPLSRRIESLTSGLDREI